MAGSCDYTFFEAHTGGFHFFKNGLMSVKHIPEDEQKLLFAKLLEIAELAFDELRLNNVMGASKSSGLIYFASFC